MADTVSFADIEGYWIAAGGDPSVAPIAAAITGAESSFNPSSIQAGQPYATTGYGLWQITPGNSEPQCGSDNDLLTPAANACAAVAKYKEAGGFSPWTTYESGAYQQFLQSGVSPTASNELTNPGTAAGSSTTAAAAAPPDSGCLIGGSNIDLLVTSFQLPCFFEKSWLRAILGGSLLVAGGVMGIFAVTVIMKQVGVDVKQAPGILGKAQGKGQAKVDQAGSKIPSAPPSASPAPLPNANQGSILTKPVGPGLPRRKSAPAAQPSSNKPVDPFEALRKRGNELAPRVNPPASSGPAKKRHALSGTKALSAKEALKMLAVA